MQSSDSFHGFGYTFWTFWIIALHLLYKLWISNMLATSITEETCIVEMRIWCKKIGTVNFIRDDLKNDPDHQKTNDVDNSTYIICIKINGINFLAPDAHFDITCLFSDARGQNMLTTGLVIPSGTNSPPAEASTQWQ